MIDMVADVVDGSTVHMVTRPVDPSQQPPQQSQPNRFFDALHGGHVPMNFVGGPGGAMPVNMNDLGSVSQCTLMMTALRIRISQCRKLCNMTTDLALIVIFCCTCSSSPA
jgi:hypothetical protein